MDTTGIVFLQLAVILIAAKLGSEACIRWGQPAVLGELLAGIALGAVALLAPSWEFLNRMRTPALPGADGIHTIAAIGVVVLLFEAGLETTVAEMRRVGMSSFLVAVIGVAVPFALGYCVSAMFIDAPPIALRGIAPDFPVAVVHVFVGATLSATSVGITARVFKDLRVVRSLEARIVLGAAVIDDVIGLVLLAIVNGVVVAATCNAGLAWASIVALCATATAFLVGALLAGIFVIPRVLARIARLRSRGIMISSALAICFAFAAVASMVGLAPIVGAFAAGLVLEDVQFSQFPESRSLRELIAPVVDFIAPVFFVLVGMQVRVEQFADAHVLLIGGALTVVAIAGKIVAGWGAVERRVHRLVIGTGMIPRGEVGLIFAGIGRTTGVLDDYLFAAIVLVVVATTLLTPLALSALMRHVAIETDVVQ